MSGRLIAVRPGVLPAGVVRHCPKRVTLAGAESVPNIVRYLLLRRGHTDAPAIMIGEKAADLIRRTAS